MEKYKIIYNDIFYKIKTGEIKAGDKLPSEKQLAEQYNVSTITAKNALNLLKTKGLVLRKKRLGTVVLNSVINSKGEKLVAVIFSSFDHLSVSLLNGLTPIAAEKNIKLSFFDSLLDPQKEREILSFLLTDNKVSGLIIMPFSESDNIDILSMFKLKKIPIVFMDFGKYAIDGPIVSSNNKLGMFDLTSFLIKQGHRDIAFFPYSHHFYPTELERFNGYCKALIENNIPIKNDLLLKSSVKFKYSPINKSCDLPSTAGDEFFEQYEKLKIKPTAVICTNDLNACAIADVASKHGISIPDQLSVTGFDNLAISLKNNITTVAQNFSLISKNALYLISKLIENKSDATQFLKIDTFIMHRNSVMALK